VLNHPHAAEMEAISTVLLEHPTLAALVEQDLLRSGAELCGGLGVVGSCSGKGLCEELS